MESGQTLRSDGAADLAAAEGDVISRSCALVDTRQSLGTVIEAAVDSAALTESALVTDSGASKVDTAAAPTNSTGDFVI
ncbi:hypothetical protein D9M68_920510 [compost metagenome]